MSDVPSFAEEASATLIHRERRSVNPLAHVIDIVEDRDVDSILEKLFHLKRRGTTWELECVAGAVQYISCMYVLPVVPLQLSSAGFDSTATVIVTVSLYCCHRYKNN